MAEALAQKSYRVETNSTILPYIVRDHAWNLPMHDASGSYFRYRDDAPAGYKEHFETEDEEHAYECPHPTNYPAGDVICNGEVVGRTDDVECEEGDEECEADAADYDYDEDEDEDADADEDAEEDADAEEGATEEVTVEEDPALAKSHKKAAKPVKHAAKKDAKPHAAKKQTAKHAKHAAPAKKASKKTLHKKHNPKNKWITDPSRIVQAPTAKPIHQAVKEIKAKHNVPKVAVKAAPAAKK